MEGNDPKVAPKRKKLGTGRAPSVDALDSAIAAAAGAVGSVDDLDAQIAAASGTPPLQQTGDVNLGAPSAAPPPVAPPLAMPPVVASTPAAPAPVDPRTMAPVAEGTQQAPVGAQVPSGAMTQAMEGAADVVHGVAHPIETAKAVVTSAINDAARVFLTPVQGAINTPDAKTGLLPYPHLAPGDMVTQLNTPNSISARDQARAGVMTAGMAGLPFGGHVVRVGAAAALGAFANPEEPIRGAVGGAALGEIVHQGVKGAGVAGEAVKTGKRKFGERLRTSDVEAEITPSDGDLSSVADDYEVSIEKQPKRLTAVAGEEAAPPKGPSVVDRAKKGFREAMRKKDEIDRIAKETGQTREQVLEAKRQFDEHVEDSKRPVKYDRGENMKKFAQEEEGAAPPVPEAPKTVEDLDAQIEAVKPVADGPQINPQSRYAGETDPQGLLDETTRGLRTDVAHMVGARAALEDVTRYPEANQEAGKGTVEAWHRDLVAARQSFEGTMSELEQAFGSKVANDVRASIEADYADGWDKGVLQRALVDGHLTEEGQPLITVTPPKAKKLGKPVKGSGPRPTAPVPTVPPKAAEVPPVEAVARDKSVDIPKPKKLGTKKKTPGEPRFEDLPKEEQDRRIAKGEADAQVRRDNFERREEEAVARVEKARTLTDEQLAARMDVVRGKPDTDFRTGEDNEDGLEWTALREVHTERRTKRAIDAGLKMPEKGEGKGLDAAVHRSVVGGWQTALWADAMEKGATDDDILKLASEAYGIQGGSYGSHGNLEHWGGANPRLEHSEGFGQPKVKLAGKKLAAKLRELLGIPQPGAKESVADAPKAAKPAPKKADAAPKAPIHETARTPGDKLRDVATVKTDGLVREYASLITKMENAAGRSTYMGHQDDSGHATSNIGSMVFGGKRLKTGMKGTTVQGAARKTLEQIAGVMTRIEQELERRGELKGEGAGAIVTRHDELLASDKERAAEEEGHLADETGDVTASDTDFDFGSTPAGTGDLFGRIELPKVEQGGLFGAGEGTEAARQKSKGFPQWASKISADEMSKRQSELGYEGNLTEHEKGQKDMFGGEKKAPKVGEVPAVYDMTGEPPPIEEKDFGSTSFPDFQDQLRHSRHPLSPIDGDNLVKTVKGWMEQQDHILPSRRGPARKVPEEAVRGWLDGDAFSIVDAYSGPLKGDLTKILGALRDDLTKILTRWHGKPRAEIERVYDTAVGIAFAVHGQVPPPLGPHSEHVSQGYDMMRSMLGLPPDNFAPLERAKRVREQLELSFGSIRKARAASTELQRIAPDVVKLRAYGLPASADRISAIRSSDRQAWVDVRGQMVRGASEAVQILNAFRNPRMERMHVLLLDEHGTVLSHTMETSGMLSTVAFGPKTMPGIIARAKRLGAVRAVIGHNHPSGDPTPSGEDKAWTLHIGYLLQKEGIRLDGHVVLDHDEASWLTPNPNEFQGIAVAKVPIAKPRAVNWTTARAGESIRHYTDAALMVHLAMPPNGFTALYLDGQHKAVALEPHKYGSIATMEKWLRPQLRAHAAATIILAGPPGVAEALLKQVLGRPKPRAILDVITITEGLKDVRSAANEGRFEGDTFDEPDARPARIVREAGSDDAESRGRGPGAGRPYPLPGDHGVGDDADRSGTRNAPASGGHSRGDAAERPGVAGARHSGARGADAAGANAGDVRAGAQGGARGRADAADLGGATGDDEGLFSPLNAPGSLGNAVRRALGMKGAPTVGKVESLLAIGQKLSKAVGVPVRQGRAKLKMRQALGVFFTKGETIRVRRLKDLSTVAHEIGHYLSKNHDLKGSAFGVPLPDRQTMKRELADMGKRLYGSRKPKGGYREEGVAEFFKFYVTDPARATSEAPRFSQHMEDVFKKEPELHDALLNARREWQRFENAPASAKIASLISVGEKDPFRYSVKKLVAQWFDDLAPIKDVVAQLGTPADITQNAGVLAQLTRGSSGQAADAIARGVVDFKTRKVVTRGLAQILEDVGHDNVQAFREYLVARQVVTKSAQGIDTGFDKAAAHAVVTAGTAKFGKHAQEVWDYRSALLDYLQGAGLMTPDEVKMIREKNPTPTPFYRQFEPDETAAGGGKGGGFARNSSGIMKMKGSDRPVIDPLESLVKDTYQMIDRANKHNAAATLIKQALGTEGGGKWIELLTEVPQEAQQVPVWQIADQLEQMGFDVPKNVDLRDLGTVLGFRDKRMGGAAEAKDLVFPVLINGARKWVAVKDRALWDALQSLGVESRPAWAKVLELPARILRRGAVLSPEFIPTNPIRDAFHLAVFSRAPGLRLPFSQLAEGIFHLAKRDGLAERWMQEGGDNAGMVGYDRATSQSAVEHMTRPGKRAIQMVKHPWELLGMVSQAMENATRVGEFAAVERSELKKGKSPREAAVAAAYAARLGTLDFAQGGRFARPTNRVIAFFNASMLGTKQVVDEFNPEKLKTPEGRSRWLSNLGRALAWVTIPSLLLYLTQKDDPDYQEAPEYLKASGWIWVQKGKDGKTKRLWWFPRPQLLGYIFGYMPEKVLGWLEKRDPDAASDLASQFVQQVAPPIIPTALRPVIENFANRSTYTDRPIVSEATSTLAPGYQSSRFTGETARVAGINLHYPPAKIENMVSGYSGGVGRYALQGSDAVVRATRKAFGQRPLKAPTPEQADPLEHIPGLKRFTRGVPGADAESVRKVFDQFKANDAERQTWRKMLDGGDAEQARTYFAHHRSAILSVVTEEEAGAKGPLREYYEAMLELSKARSEIENARTDDDEKIARAKAIESRMVALARRYYGKSQK